MIGTTQGTWLVRGYVTVSASRRGETRRNRTMADCVCIHCGRERLQRTDVRSFSSWHHGCNRAEPPKTYARKTTRDNCTPSGESPLWAEWSSWLENGDPRAAKFTVGRVEQIKCWRSNQDWVERPREERRRAVVW